MSIYLFMSDKDDPTTIFAVVEEQGEQNACERLVREDDRYTKYDTDECDIVELSDGAGWYVGEEVIPPKFVQFMMPCADFTDADFISYINDNRIFIKSAKWNGREHDVTFICYKEQATKFVTQFWHDDNTEVEYTEVEYSH